MWMSCHIQITEDGAGSASDGDDDGDGNMR